MKCPICNSELTENGLGEFGCWNEDCSLYSIPNMPKRFWDKLQNQIDKRDAAYPRWRPFDMEAMRKSLPVVVYDPEVGLGTWLLNNSQELESFSVFTPNDIKTQSVWLPVPKVEVVK